MKKYILLYENYCRKLDVDGKTIKAKIGNKTLKLKVLTTPQSQVIGYMNSKEPKENEGLLFIYDEELPLTFWMKNVKFPLDILFFDSNMNFINYHSMKADSGSNILPKYKSKKPARFAIEVKYGWCKKYLDPNNAKLKL